LSNEHNARAIVLLKPYILQFLEQKKVQKQTGEYNNLENNSFNGLNDPSTIAELCAMAILDIAILTPFLKKVNSSLYILTM
jgi:hypothetical protein